MTPDAAPTGGGSGPADQGGRAGGRLSIRRARPSDIPACGRTWRDALNGYLVRLGQPEIPNEPGSIGRLHAHAMTTDPDRFLVAVRGDRVVAFASALDREPLWYLSMLFVEPAEQGRGLGRRLLERVMPDAARRAGRFLAVASDSVQPISNALYAAHGMPPRITLHHLVGRPVRDNLLPSLPPGVTAHPVAADAASLPADIHALDRELLGFAHPADHAFAVAQGRLPHVYRNADGSLAGYGYASSVGHVGPVAARDPGHLSAITGHLLQAVVPRGASAVWVPGDAGETFTGLIRAGLRIEGFPVLLLWDRPLVDFDRYLPQSPGLL